MKNELSATDKISIHLRGSPKMPILSGRTFTYTFRAYPAGTFFCHSHAGLQAQTAFGPLIVHDLDNPWNATEIAEGPLLFSDSWISSDRHGM